MTDCLFCKIKEGDIPSDKLHEDEFVLAFKDIHPKAPTHILIIPKKHIASVNHLEDEDADLVGKMILTAKNLAKENSISEGGYRLIFNTNENAGQEVQHIHLHLLGGKKLSSMA